MVYLKHATTSEPESVGPASPPRMSTKLQRENSSENRHLMASLSAGLGVWIVRITIMAIMGQKMLIMQLPSRNRMPFKVQRPGCKVAKAKAEGFKGFHFLDP